MSRGELMLATAMGVFFCAAHDAGFLPPLASVPNAVWSDVGRNIPRRRAAAEGAVFQSSDQDV